MSPLRKGVEFFDCWSCGCNLQILPHQHVVTCGFCKNKNEVYWVNGPSAAIDTVILKGKPVQHQLGKTTDDDDIIDIKYQEL